MNTKNTKNIFVRGFSYPKMSQRELMKSASDCWDFCIDQEILEQYNNQSTQSAKTDATTITKLQCYVKKESVAEANASARAEWVDLYFKTH
jgi:hypothetical protein